MTEYEQIFGGADVTVKVADHATRTVADETVLVRTLTLAEWPLAIGRRAHADPHALVQMVTGKPRNWVECLAPPSFQLLCAEARRVNPDFFAYGAQQEAEALALVKAIPADVLAAAVAAQRGTSGSAGTSPTSPRRPG